MTDPIRIANCSGFFGDRLAAARVTADGTTGTPAAEPPTSGAEA